MRVVCGVHCPYLCVLLLLAPALAGAETDFAQAIWNRAEALLADDKAVEASDEFRKLVFAGTPLASKAAKRIKELNDKICDELIELAASVWKEEPELGQRILGFAFDLDGKNKKVKAAYEERGFEFFQGAYYPAIQVAILKADRDVWAILRHSALGLSGEYKFFTGGPFRFYTNLPMKDTKVRLMATTVQTHYAAYVEQMKPLGLRFPAEGLDVVLCRTRDEYVQLTGSEGSVGVYIPSKEAGFFFLTGAGDDFNTLMHEMTHQLNVKVLENGLMLPLCLEEGLAEYFGAGTLSAGNKKVVLGNPNYQIVTVKDAIHGREGGRLIEFRDFLTAEESSEGFYPQSWGLVHFLMHGLPQGRLVLADALMTAKRAWARGKEDTIDLVEILGRYGLSPTTLQEKFRAFYQ